MMSHKAHFEWSWGKVLLLVPTKNEVSPVQEQNLVQSFLLLVTTKLQSGYKDKGIPIVVDGSC